MVIRRGVWALNAFCISYRRGERQQIMARRSHHNESEGVWAPCLTLLLVTLISCTAVYMVLSPLFKHTHPSDPDFNSTFENPQGIECCRGIPHQELWGKAVKWGTAFKVNTSQQCCNACKSMCTDDGPCLCNSWVFCGDRKRCAEKFGQCWLKKQEDPLSPDVQESGDKVYWTSGLIYGQGVGIIALETQHGTIHIKLLPDCAPLSVAYILELLKVRHCAGCQFYRAEGRGNNWDVEGNRIPKSQAGPPYALLQGTFEAQGTSFKEIPKEACPSVKKGAVAWIEGGPDFFISLANHVEWNKKYTVFASVLPEDMAVLEKIVELPTTPAIWGGIKVAVLEKYISLKVKRSVNMETQLSS